MGKFYDGCDRVDSTQRVRLMHYRHHPRPVVEHGLVFVHQEFAIVVERDDLQLDADLLPQYLPGDDVRVVLHPRDDHLVSGVEVFAPVTAGYQVQTLGRAPDVDHLIGRRSVDEPPHGLSTGLIVVRGSLAERMHAAVHVGIVLEVVIADGVNDGSGFLSRGGVVEVHQRLPVDLLAQDRKVLA